ncbi:hypothetical protein BU25DRAFT_463895 [Macroventuria anomochaeta]|uniref:Uncharacterized protein n=1 Tax=Macroventuria anomochaeta TaxID=301207 RepID=A0ACB6RGX4_9PLEO|nr:uncharacterized protein BU25DRAFT_463895 [Macroventuria anomochaeta]KAF2621165.1 hypothetical protein BU25DRAFT_463895 [Macroventuria anomochaeta]
MFDQLARYRSVRDRQNVTAAARADVRTLVNMASDEFTNPENLEAFWEWQWQGLKAEMSRKPIIERHTPLSGREIWDTVFKMKSYDYGSCTAAKGDLNCLSYEYLGLGVMDDAGERFRLTLVQDFLIATREPPRDSGGVMHVMPQMFLGVVATDDGGNDRGFVFAQLGELDHFVGDEDYEEVAGESLGNGSFRGTVFGVVVKFESTGQTGSVWLIFNLKPENSDGARYCYSDTSL